MTEDNRAEHLEDEDMTPLACCDITQLATEMMKRGTCIIGVVIEDKADEDSYLFANECYSERVSLTELLENVNEHTAEIIVDEEEYSSAMKEYHDLDDDDDYAEGWSEMSDDIDKELDEEEDED